ncbi:MAG: TetR/AcrR family transcriptional regulator, partial [Hyphomicrobiaceae bacterium]|nr:TetR/AcrR family transcriptional regulator [Hyphomicrobiaceae bacterium]
LRQAALAIHRFNKTQLTEERRIHDMVEVAMAENWDVVHAHKQALAGIFARIIADGIAADEFPPQDALAAAEMFKLCHISVFHPTLIAHCAGDDQERQTREITEFVLRGLMARGG